MDNTIRLALIVLLQRECYKIKDEIKTIKGTYSQDNNIKIITLNDRKRRVKFIKGLIEKMKSENKGNKVDKIDDDTYKKIDDDPIDFNNDIQFGMN